MLITTSRKPSQQTRTIARFLAGLLGGRYFSRGKASFESVLGEADSQGFKRVLFVGEDHGNVGSLSFWEEGWLEPEVKLRGVFFAGVKRAERVGVVVSEDDFGKRLEALFCVEGDGGTRMVLNRQRIIFSGGGKRFLEFKLC